MTLLELVSAFSAFTNTEYNGHKWWCPRELNPAQIAYQAIQVIPGRRTPHLKYLFKRI